MELDMYGERVATAAQLVRDLTGGEEWFTAFDRNTQHTLELFIAAVDKVTADVLASLPSTAGQAPVREVPELNPDRVEWIVNDMGELGVRVDGVHYFCYKGESLIYESGKHDDGTPILHRNVGKREFGECVWPAAWYERGHRDDRYSLELVYTPGLSFGPPDNPKYKWLPLPAAPVLQETKP